MEHGVLQNNRLFGNKDLYIDWLCIRKVLPIYPFLLIKLVAH